MPAKASYMKGSGDCFQLYLQSLTPEPQLKSECGLKPLSCFGTKTGDLGKAAIDCRGDHISPGKCLCLIE